jgi:FixJ family two-component response regulator
MSMTASSRGAVVREAKAAVMVIDDDRAVCDSLGRLLRSVDLDAHLFASVPDFLTAALPNTPSCLVLDVRLPGRSGLDFQRELAAANIHIPIIFITGYGDIPMSVQAMKGGAIEFLTKPFRDQDLLEAIEVGLARDRDRREHDQAVSVLRERLEALTSREREIMIQVMRGRLSKQIAFDLGISEVTVKVHRSNMMRKMGAASLPELGRMADRLNLLA